MLIRRAFTDLLRQKPIQAITISQLCQQAGINRSTFYTHYTDIYDLREQLEAQMVEDFKQALLPLRDEAQSPPTLVQVTTAVFQCIKEHSDFCIVTLGENGDKTFARKMISLGRQFCMDAYRDYFKDASPRQISYFYAFASSGCIGLLQQWFDDGLTDSAEDMAKIAEGFMVKGMAFLSDPSLE